MQRDFQEYTSASRRDRRHTSNIPGAIDAGSFDCPVWIALGSLLPPLVAILFDHFGGNFAHLARPEIRLQITEINAMTFHGVLGKTSEMRTLEFDHELFERHPLACPSDLEQ